MAIHSSLQRKWGGRGIPPCFTSCSSIFCYWTCVDLIEGLKVLLDIGMESFNLWVGWRCWQVGSWTVLHWGVVGPVGLLQMRLFRPKERITSWVSFEGGSSVTVGVWDVGSRVTVRLNADIRDPGESPIIRINLSGFRDQFSVLFHLCLWLVNLGPSLRRIMAISLLSSVSSLFWAQSFSCVSGF